jgi:hypothetical protein
MTTNNSNNQKKSISKRVAHKKIKEDFPDHLTAIEEARKRFNWDEDSLKRYGCKTVRDVRDFVIFNMLAGIDKALNHTTEHSYLLEIQRLIFETTFEKRRV